jgi:hypothetical protein
MFFPPVGTLETLYSTNLIAPGGSMPAPFRDLPNPHLRLSCGAESGLKPETLIIPMSWHNGAHQGFALNSQQPLQPKDFGHAEEGSREILDFPPANSR